MKFKVVGGYLELEPQRSVYEEISKHLADVAKKEETEKRKVNSIRNFKDVENIGEREGDPNTIN